MDFELFDDGLYQGVFFFEIVDLGYFQLYGQYFDVVECYLEYFGEKFLYLYCVYKVYYCVEGRVVVNFDLVVVGGCFVDVGQGEQCGGYFDFGFFVYVVDIQQYLCGSFSYGLYYVCCVLVEVYCVWVLGVVVRYSKGGLCFFVGVWFFI